MLTGSVFLAIISLWEVGGYEALLDKYAVSNPSPNVSNFKLDSLGNNVSCGAVNPDFMRMLQSPDPERGSEIPWTGFFGND